MKQLLEKNNIQSPSCPLDKVYKDKLLKSWKHIFNWDELDKQWHRESTGESIQAIFLELKMEWVNSIIYSIQVRR